MCKQKGQERFSKQVEGQERFSTQVKGTGIQFASEKDRKDPERKCIRQEGFNTNVKGTGTIRYARKQE